jgi:hypothetical protein
LFSSGSGLSHLIQHESKSDGWVAAHDYTQPCARAASSRAGKKNEKQPQTGIATLTLKMRRKPPVRRGATWTVIAIFGSVLTLSAQEANKPVMSAAELMRVTVQNEMAAANHSQIKHMFCSHKSGGKESQTHLYVETTQAMAGMLIATDGHPLTAEQKQAEVKRLNGLVSNPDALRRKHAREKEDTDHSLRILKALPDAFRYEYVGAEPGTAAVGGMGAQLFRLKFTPNPSYNAPTRVEQVLAGMQGYLLIDANQHRIAKIDGTLFREVSFGWGIIGRLDKGGGFQVEQADVGDGAWEITEMDLHITGKVLIFKSLNYTTNEVFSDFQRVPDDTTFAQGVELLKTKEEKLAQSGPLSLGKKAE